MYRSSLIPKRLQSLIPVNSLICLSIYRHLHELLLLPLTVATILGAVILAVSARWKHKNLVNIGLTLLLILGVLGGSMVLSWQGGTPEGTDQLQNLLKACQKSAFSALLHGKSAAVLADLGGSLSGGHKTRSGRSRRTDSDSGAVSCGKRGGRASDQQPFSGV